MLALHLLFVVAKRNAENRQGNERGRSFYPKRPDRQRAHCRAGSAHQGRRERSSHHSRPQGVDSDRSEWHGFSCSVRGGWHSTGELRSIPPRVDCETKNRKPAKSWNDRVHRGLIEMTSLILIKLARVRNNFRPCTLSAVLVALFSAGAWPQTQLATVSGTVTDPSGAVVPGVSVTIVSQGTGLERSALTDTAGAYRFAGLPTGIYDVRLQRTGFQSQVRQGIEITSAAEVKIDSQLAI